MYIDAVCGAVLPALGKYLYVLSLGEVNMNLAILPVIFVLDSHSSILGHRNAVLDTPPFEKSRSTNLDTNLRLHVFQG